MARREEFTKQQREAIRERAGGKCEKCHAVLKVGEGQFDHIVEYTLTRDTSVENGQLLCGVCHGRKTAERATALAKVRRQELKHKGCWPPSPTPLRSRNTFRSRWLPVNRSPMEDAE